MANNKGSAVLRNILKRKDEINEDNMAVVKFIKKPNGGITAYIRYDALVFEINKLKTRKS